MWRTVMTKERIHRQQRRTTMVDVAQAAGVSQTTVSFVLNDRRDVVVAEKTRQRVLQAADALNYQPNRAAQSLRLNQSFLVGIVTSGIVAGPYAGRIIAGIQKAVQAAGQLCMVVDATEDPAEGDAAVANFLAQGVTAIIYASHRPVAMHTSPLLRQTRCLFVNCWPTDRAVAETVILADEYGGGRKAAEAAFGAGHTDVAFLGGTLGEYACGERHRGFVDAAAAAGIEPGTLFQTNGNYDISSGYDTTLEAFRRGHPTALVCGNDRMAVGAILALHTLGLEVPRDVSVVGFDDQPDVADQLRPALTTVALPHYEMGRRSGQLLIGPPVHPIAHPPAEITVACPLIERDSLGPAPIERRFERSRRSRP
jgi:LacI family transcriptional regulator